MCIRDRSNSCSQKLHSNFILLQNSENQYSHIWISLLKSHSLAWSSSNLLFRRHEIILTRLRSLPPHPHPLYLTTSPPKLSSLQPCRYLAINRTHLHLSRTHLPLPNHRISQQPLHHTQPFHLPKGNKLPLSNLTPSTAVSYTHLTLPTIYSV